ncbi:hypothetical protein [Streptomyces klenkii]
MADHPWEPNSSCRDRAGVERTAAWRAVEASSHRVDGLAVTQKTDGTIQASIDFGWQGVAPGGRPMTARTHHEWTPAETGGTQLRLREFTVAAVQPFTAVTATQTLADFRSRLDAGNRRIHTRAGQSPARLQRGETRRLPAFSGLAVGDKIQ